MKHYQSNVMYKTPEHYNKFGPFAGALIGGTLGVLAGAAIVGALNCKPREYKPQDYYRK